MERNANREYGGDKLVQNNSSFVLEKSMGIKN